ECKVRGATLPCFRGLCACQQCGRVVELEAEGIPAVAERQRATERAWRAAAEPDRDALLDATGIDEPVVEAKVGAVVAGLGAAEGGAQGPQGVLVEGAAVVELCAEEAELLGEGPDADAQDEASIAKAIERAVALRDLEGVMVRQHEHVRDEADARRA